MKKNSFFKNIKKMWKYVRNSKGSLIGYLFVSIVEGVIGAILPLISAKIILNITDALIRVHAKINVATFIYNYGVIIRLHFFIFSFL